MRDFALPRAVLLLTVALSTGYAAAMYASLTDNELIERSEVIVAGTLAEERRVGQGAQAQRVGVIRIDEAIKGTRAAEVLIALPAADRPVSSSDIAYRIGQKGLWYLRVEQAGAPSIYAADHPQRFVPLDAARPQIEALRSRIRR